MRQPLSAAGNGVVALGANAVHALAHEVLARPHRERFHLEAVAIGPLGACVAQAHHAVGARRDAQIPVLLHTYAGQSELRDVQLAVLLCLNADQNFPEFPIQLCQTERVRCNTLFQTRHSSAVFVAALVQVVGRLHAAQEVVWQLSECLGTLRAGSLVCTVPGSLTELQRTASAEGGREHLDGHAQLPQRIDRHWLAFAVPHALLHSQVSH